jgi:plasmid stabilization system protein ParE
MGRTTPALAVIYSATANKEIQGVWKHNAEFYSSADHATDYVKFLYERMENLSTAYEDGKAVETNDKLRYITMKRSSRGNGHITVYRITKTAVRSVHVFHTSQNWENKVKPRSK